MNFNINPILFIVIVLVIIGLFIYYKHKKKYANYYAQTNVKKLIEKKINYSRSGYDWFDITKAIVSIGITVIVGYMLYKQISVVSDIVLNQTSNQTINNSVMQNVSMGLQTGFSSLAISILPLIVAVALIVTVGYILFEFLWRFND